MKEMKLRVVESKFAGIVCGNEPCGSGEIVKLCEKELGWEKSTTYTVLKKLCERGLFCNTDGIATSLVSRNDFYSHKVKNLLTMFLKAPCLHLLRLSRSERLLAKMILTKSEK